MESKKLEWFSLSERSLLWIHGGHPLLPSSSDIVDKYHLILNFVETHWPREKACNQGLLFWILFWWFFYMGSLEGMFSTQLIFSLNNTGMLSSHPVDVVASFDHNLRFLVMQGMLA